MREFHNTVYKGNLRIVYIEEILLSCKLSDWKGRCTTYVYININPDSYKGNFFVQLAVILHVASQMATTRMYTAAPRQYTAAPRRVWMSYPAVLHLHPPLPLLCEGLR